VVDRYQFDGKARDALKEAPLLHEFPVSGCQRLRCPSRVNHKNPVHTSTKGLPTRPTTTDVHNTSLDEPVYPFPNGLSRMIGKVYATLHYATRAIEKFRSGESTEHS
jgi:hypothetical protein